MFEAKRTEGEILDDFKKIVGSESAYSFITKICALVDEWIKNKYDSNIIFKFSDKFNRVEKAGYKFPKEITIVDCLITMRGDDGKKTIMEKHLNPHVTCSGGRTTLMLVCQSRERFFDFGVKGYIKNCLILGIDKNAVDESGKTALDYLLTTARCQSHLELEKNHPELKEVLTGFLTGEEVLKGFTGEEIRPGKEIRADNNITTLKERNSLLEKQVHQLQKENLHLKQENSRISLLEKQVQQLQEKNLGLEKKLAEQVRRGSIATPQGPINFANSKEFKVMRVYSTTLAQLADKQKALDKKDAEIYQKDKEIATLKEKISTLGIGTKLEDPQASTSTSSRGY